MGRETRSVFMQGLGSFGDRIQGQSLYLSLIDTVAFLMFSEGEK